MAQERRPGRKKDIAKSSTKRRTLNRDRMKDPAKETRKMSAARARKRGGRPTSH